LPLPVIAAHIRLGRKYDFRELLDLALARLTFENPTTLEEYDALLSPVLGYRPTRGAFYFDILALAREHNISSVLPVAYYHVVLCASSADDLFKAVKRDDGTEASLALVDLRRCVSGRGKNLVTRTQPGYTHGWCGSWTPSINCTPACTTIRESHLRTLLATRSLKALFNFSSEWVAKHHPGLCAACK
ncbi:hypothetical protein B0H16DRAFT_1357062, partial [Mycena metata]